MVKLNLDTARDAVEDLEEAITILQEAVTRRKATASIEKGTAPPERAEETALETPFFTIKVESEAEEPTLNELLTDESLSDQELTDLFKATGGKEKPKEKKKPKEEQSEDSFIEIVEFEDEEDKD